MNGTCAVLLKTDLTIEIVSAKEAESMLDFCYRAIECDTIEAVSPRHLQDGYILVCDEEFLLKDKPVVNYIGSYFSDVQNGGNPLCGKVLILRDEEDEDGARDFGWMNQAEAEVLASAIEAVALPAYLIVHDTLVSNGLLKEECR